MTKKYICIWCGRLTEGGIHHEVNCDGIPHTLNSADRVKLLMRKVRDAYAAGVAAEREAIAQLGEYLIRLEGHDENGQWALREFVDAIRARGEGKCE